jgi:hypothetical protein
MKTLNINQLIFATFAVSKKTIKTRLGKEMINLISSIVIVKEDYKINLDNLIYRLKILESKGLNIYYITPFGSPFNQQNIKDNKLFYIKSQNT